LGGNFIKDEKVRVSGVYLIWDTAKIHLHKNRRRKWVKILLAVLVFLLFSVFSAYLPYNYCVETDFPSSELRFGNLDQNYLLADELNKLGISRSSPLPTIPESIYPGKLLSSFQKSPYDQEPVILRC
jgi:hypothetical protein